MNIDAVDRDVGDLYVLVCDAVSKVSGRYQGQAECLDSLRNITRSIAVCLDPSPVLAVKNLRVLEQDVRHVVVALPADTANAEAMAAVAVHPGDRDMIATSDGYAVVLVQHRAVPQDSVVACADVKAVGIVRRSQPV